MSSTHAVECPLGASIKDNCQTDSLEYVVLDIDEKETLQLRSGCDASVNSVCQYHWHKYFEIYIWVIPCQLIHFFGDPSSILMKFGKLGGLQKKLIHTKFQLISTIFNGVRAL